MKEQPTDFTGVFLVAISDSWFALFVVTSKTNELWPSTMIFAAHNVIIAAGLLWYVVALAAARTNSNHTNLNEGFEENKSQQQYGLNKPE